MQKHAHTHGLMLDIEDNNTFNNDQRHAGATKALSNIEGRTDVIARVAGAH